MYIRRWIVTWLAVLAACEPSRRADFAGVVTGPGRGAIDRGANGWTISAQSDSRDTRHGAGEPMTLYLSARQARGLRAGAASGCGSQT